MIDLINGNYYIFLFVSARCKDFWRFYKGQIVMLDDWVRVKTAAPVVCLCSAEVNIHHKWPEEETRLNQ